MRRFLARARAPPRDAGPDASDGRGLGAAEECEREDATYPSYAEVRHTPPPATPWHRDAKGEGLPSLLPGVRPKKSEHVGRPRRHRPPFAIRRRIPAVDLGADLHQLELNDAPLPPTRCASEEAVPAYLAEFFHAEPTDADWECVHELGELVNQSPAHSKAALRALQHELRGPMVAAQCRAVRTWGVWSMHAGRYFAEVATNTQLLAQLEDILTNPLTYPALRSDALLVVGALASRSRQNDRLHKVARLWARTRPSTSPEHGVPLSAPLFCDGAPSEAGDDPYGEPVVPSPPSPPLLPAQDPASIPPRTVHVPDSLSPGLPLPHAVPASLTPSHSSHGSCRADMDGERRALVEQKCHTAKMNAALLTELVESGEDDAALLDEIHAKIQEAQCELEPHLAWASERASTLEGAALCVAEELLHTILSALSSANEALALRDTQSGAACIHGDSFDASEDEGVPAQPSAKALGKRRALDEPCKPPLPPLPDS
ncbi:unnamed protein product [Malassezia sympodialis ATCC 42132]|uniref:Uncharacterized protein n=1 Tax=Malassezia sympodialis (strain ATCC 42132) TaxID=1230383 RepID=M5ECA2_MALS4|nr:uncharacterized protein MSY001_2668 [Malassezia sympodialis ATCC 42132]CCU99963.1 unnamed protein product [Malassezia sympodialis ATCC 42132]SHO76185.1 Uncharacterized protein MSYG_0520 [Malassezia sympodialis ATCC 42132]|eukprot:XP_018741183.1 uncharacterized protein MSY001_2668 [Malassezia sympodialis ATCC 42132]